ncbi:MAG: protein BatD [SAR324 cluster bacterium]|nr:protein BatD [SAR324 cluster bacterium]
MKRYALRWLVLFWVWLCFVPPLSAVEFSAHVDKTKGSIEDQFLLTLVIKGVTNYSLSRDITIPDFKVNFQNQSSQSQWINGKGSTQMSHRYVLFPLKTGKLTIPAFSTSVDGKEYRTQSIVLEVSDAADIPVQNKPAFVRSFLSSEQSYPNQQVLYTFELFIRKGLKVANIRFEHPDFSDFHVKELENEGRPVDRNIGGQVFESYTVRYALSPRKQGKIQIPPATLHGVQAVQQRLNAFFNNPLFASQGKPFQLRTEALELTVLPFPAKDRPQSFYGLVGNYKIQATLSQSEIKTGDSATVKITVSGPGRAESIQKPKFQLDKTVKIYEDQPSYQTEFKGSQQIGKAIFTMAIVPSQAGIKTFPPVSVTFFNPESRSFETLHASLPPLKVLAGEKEQLTTVGGNLASSQKHGVVRLGEDLLPIHQDMVILQNTGGSSGFLLSYGLIFLLAPFCFGMFFFWKWKIEHSAANKDKIRSSQAFSKFRREIKEIRSSVHENQKISPAIMMILKNYIGDKANKYGDALTSREIETWLTEKQVNEELVTQLKSLLDQCEMAQYASGSFPDEGKDQLFQQSQLLVERLEEQLK